MFKQKGKNLWLWFLPALLFPFMLHAKPNAKLPEKLLDSVSTPARYYSPETVKEYKNDNDFKYREEKEETGSMFNRFAEWVLKKFSAGSSPEKKERIKLILEWGGGIIGLVLLIWFLVKSERFSVLSPSYPVPVSVQFYDFEGNEDQLDQRLSEAENSADYPLALRYLFIKSLFALRNAELIRWRPGKTNLEYLNELKNPTLKKAFANLVNSFEYGFYGNYSISEESYSEVKKQLALMKAEMEGGSDVTV